MMKRYGVLLAVVALVFPAVAWAGMNVDAAYVVSAGQWTKSVNCTSLAVTACSELHPNYTSTAAPGSPDANVYIALYVGREGEGLDPLAVAGIDFGIDYNADAVYSPVWNKCGDLEIPTDGSTAPAWPTPGSGDSMIWNFDQIANVILIGWFKVTVYAGYGDALFHAVAHPLDGFALVVDPTGTQDHLRLGSTADVLAGSGGSNIDCNPASPIRETTWGRIKSQY